MPTGSVTYRLQAGAGPPVARSKYSRRDSVRQCGGNSGVAEAANGHAATVEIRGVSASMAGAMSSTIPSICI